MIRLFIIVNFLLVSGLPRSRNDNNKLTTYDQKQTGDYNIQLHLKDFQIVALLGEDTLGAFGDYEYNYDYSDLTIKPHNTTTAKPNEISTQKPLTPSTPVPSTTTQKLPESSLSSSSTTNSSKTVRSDNNFIEISSTTTEKLLTQKVPSVTIVPQETANNNNSTASILNLGEILHYRKCPSGYSKDKRGRCRRTRRPGVIPYGITRFASNLAAKFRHAISDEEEINEE